MGKQRLHLFHKHPKPAPPSPEEEPGFEAWSGLHLALTPAEERELRADGEWNVGITIGENGPRKHFIRTLKLSCFMPEPVQSFEDEEEFMRGQFRIAGILSGYVDDPEPEMTKTELYPGVVSYEFIVPGRQLTRADRMCIGDIDERLDILATQALQQRFQRQPRTPLPDQPPTP